MPQSTPENLQVLYEDNHLIAVNKRPGDIVQGDKTGDTPLSEVVKLWLKAKYQKPGNVFAGVAHRIDRPVSGVVVLAKTSKALARLNELFKTKGVQKTYWACVYPAPQQPQATLSDLLLKDEATNKSRVVGPGHPHGKECILHYTMLAASDRYALLEVNPVTGRHHQIRLQLAHAGMPIKGDVKYGARRSNPDGSIHLHARQITMVHPVAKTPLTITAPPPADAIWDHFARLPV